MLITKCYKMLQNVNARYCWLRPDGEYSEHKYRNLEEIDDFEKDEANK